MSETTAPGGTALPAVLALATVPAHARAALRSAARLLGEAHAAAGLTPYIAGGIPEDDYSRALSGYTSYVEHDEGVVLLLTALGVPLSREDDGPWYRACWEIARAYTGGYDSVLMTPGQMTEAMRRLGMADAALREGDQCDWNPAGTLLQGRYLAVVYPGRAAQDRDGGAMAMPLTLVVYPTEPDGSITGEPEDTFTGLTPDAVLDLLDTCCIRPAGASSQHERNQGARDER